MHEGLVELAREWLRECSWTNMEDSDFDDLNAQEICNAVRRYYDGGEAGFIRDSVEVAG